jgi:hypothetical protein
MQHQPMQGRVPFAPLIGLLQALKHAGSRVARMVTVIDVNKNGQQNVAQVTTFVSTSNLAQLSSNMPPSIVATTHGEAVRKLPGARSGASENAHLPIISVDSGATTYNAQVSTPVPTGAGARVSSAQPSMASVGSGIASAPVVLNAPTVVLTQASPVREQVEPPPAQIEPEPAVCNESLAVAPQQEQVRDDLSARASVTAVAMPPAAKSSEISDKDRDTASKKEPESSPKVRLLRRTGDFELPQARVEKPAACGGCGLNRKSDRYCSECGAVINRSNTITVPTLSCDRCHASVSERHNFCPCCGNAVSVSNALTSVTQLFGAVESDEIPTFEA